MLDVNALTYKSAAPREDGGSPAGEGRHRCEEGALCGDPSDGAQACGQSAREAERRRVGLRNPAPWALERTRWTGRSPVE
ncbi:hypothetical protein GCM10027074_72620 [Streptomyces deserti]